LLKRVESIQQCPFGKILNWFVGATRLRGFELLSEKQEHEARLML